jgi:NAD(P)-dependent dehydrogenase (short-subunit alcohol dehydrogenase family)
VTDSAAVDHLAVRTVDAFGAVHLVCNNAGVTTNGRTWELSLEDWRWVIDVNLWGVIHGINTFVPLLIEQGEGHVVNTSSMAGVGILNNLAPYLASKHAVAAISEGLAAELAEVGSAVGVSVLCPGAVRTKILTSDRNREPGAGLGQAVPEEVVNLIDQGLEPVAVAEMVVDAVRHQRFWIFTHPGMLGLVERRMRGMLEGHR